MKTFAVLLACLLTAAEVVAAPAVSAAEAKAQVSKQSRQVQVYLAARQRLVAERAQLQAKADQLSTQVTDGKRNRGVLSDTNLKTLLREALEVGKALEATDRKIAVLDQMTRDVVNSVDRSVERYAGQLSDAEGKALRAEAARLRASLPVGQKRELAGAGNVNVTAGMDAEALMERADLAGDYEDKLIKEAARAERRIKELHAQASMAGEAAMFAQDRRFFEEEDRSMRATRSVTRTGSTAAANNNTAAPQDPAVGGGGKTTDDTRTGGGDSPAPAAGFSDGETNAAQESGGAGNAAPPPSAPSGNMSSGGLAAARTETVVDERTFALLREGSAPSVASSPADELRRLQARREALLRAAARLKVIREELTTRAQQSSMSPRQ